ncbi:MAG: hypothetical protein R3C01_03115 [Planctomycetaceae bacterium]
MFYGAPDFGVSASSSPVLRAGSAQPATTAADSVAEASFHDPHALIEHYYAAKDRNDDELGSLGRMDFIRYE